MKKQAKKYHAQKVKWNDKTGNRTETKFKINPKYDKVLEIVGTKHGFGLEVTEEDGFSKDKARLVQDNGDNSKGKLI